MRMVVHFENLLLLSSQVLRLSITVHNCKTHGAWHEDVVVISVASSSIGRFHKVILVWSSLLDRLKLLIIRILTAVVSYISSILVLDTAFLIVAIEILDIQGVSSLMVTQLSCRSRLKSLVLRSSPSLGV